MRGGGGDQISFSESSTKQSRRRLSSGINVVAGIDEEYEVPRPVYEEDELNELVSAHEAN